MIDHYFMNFLGSNHTIHTDSQMYEISFRDNELFFENRKVKSIFSLFNVEKDPYVDPTVMH